MNALERVERKQRIREAEGYLELLAALGERSKPSLELRRPLVARILVLLPADLDFGGKAGKMWFLRGQAQRMVEDYTGAIESLIRAGQAEPQNLSIWLSLGWCHKRMNRLDLAIEALEEAMAIDAAQAIVHYNLACYWSLAGNASLATRYLSQAFDLNPDYRDLVADESDFDPIRKDPEFQAITSVVV